MPIFTTTAMPHPERISQSSSHSEEQNVLRSPFNDGYIQTVPNGINNMLAQWDFAWTSLTVSERNTVVGVLRSVGGSGVLEWTPPYEASPKYFKVASGFRESFPSGIHSDISVQLYEVV